MKIPYHRHDSEMAYLKCGSVRDSQSCNDDRNPVEGIEFSFKLNKIILITNTFPQYLHS